MRQKIKAIRLLACVVIFAASFQSSQAANWFQAQGVSNPKWGKGKVLGWIQPDYSQINGNSVNIKGHDYTPRFNQIGPDFSDTSQLAIQRARLMLRGSLNPDISYFLAGEFGNNGYDYSSGTYKPQVFDAHVTFSNYVPGARIQLGLIRAPGPEGAMQGYMGYNFIDLFPTVIGQLMQPNFYNSGRTYPFNPATGGYLVPSSDLSSGNGFRYPGVEAFDWFRVKRNIELSYGAMVGQYGNQLESDSANGPIFAGRVQLSYLYGGGGSLFRNDLTGFAWYQQARPQLNGARSTMKREGFGATYRRGYMEAGGKSLKVEYMQGSGNIMAPAVFNQSPVLLPAQYQTTFYPGSENKASGYYLTAGLFVTDKIELNARYDYYDRLSNIPSQERIFKNTGIGVQYHFSPLTRVVADYFVRKIDIPNPNAIGAPGSPQLTLAKNIANSIGNEFDIYAIFAF